jgi:serine phosphatase RsbU (regulator of sigma subunit)
MKAMLRISSDFKKERETQLRRFRRLTLAWTGVVLLVAIICSALLLKSETMRTLERKISWPLQFHLRDKLGNAPKMDRRIHVIMFDDSTVQRFNKATLSMAEWASLLAFLDRHKPASIYIDKIFGLVDDELSNLVEVLPQFRGLRTRVSVGSFTTSVKIPGRNPLDINAPQFRARNFLTDSDTGISDEELQAKLNAIGFKDRSSAYAYGPIPELRDIFNQGHIDWLRENEIFPIYRLNDTQVLPTLALTGRVNLKLENGGISAAGKRIPLNSDGSLLVNWLRPEEVYSQASTVAEVLDAARRDRDWERIPKNAHIIILPLAFTGNADFKSSPYGPALGGMIHVSLLNSVLNHSWLSEMKGSLAFLIVVVLALGALQFVRGMKAWLILLGAVVLLVLLSLSAFIYNSVDVPWVMGASIIGLAGVFTLSIRNLWESRRDSLLLSLEGEFERLEKEEKRLAKEMADATRIALALKPEEAPDWPNYWISSFHKSLNEASGDWYFFERSPSGRYGHFVLCDITGHGVQAALVVSSCKTILSSLRMADNSAFESEKFIYEYARRLNSVLFLHGRGTHSTTLVGITFDFETHTMNYINCGHPFPLWHSCNDTKSSVGLLGSVGDPLGFSEGLNIVSSSKTVNVGDLVIVHSDGVPLSRSRRILKRYLDEVDSGIMISAKRLHDACAKEFVRTGHEPIQDDVSLVVFRRQS